MKNLQDKLANVQKNIINLELSYKKTLTAIGQMPDCETDFYKNMASSIRKELAIKFAEKRRILSNIKYMNEPRTKLNGLKN